MQQNPTDIALEMMICRTMEERLNNDSRTKYYDDSHATDKDARHPEEPATGLKNGGSFSFLVLIPTQTQVLRCYMS